MAVSYSITGGLTHLSGNPIQITLTASATKTNHKLLLKVTCKDVSGNELVGSPSIEEIAPKSLVAVFDISGIVDYPADYGFTFPPSGKIAAHGVLAVKVTFEVGESWTDNNGDYQEQFTAGTDTITVLKGKLRQHELSILNEANKSFASEYIAADKQKFLTHQPDYMRVSPTHICQLWYLGKWATNHSLWMMLKVTSDKGQEYLYSEQTTIYVITGLVEFEFSSGHWGVTMGAGERAVKYEFWLSSDSVDSAALDLTERRHYIVDDTYYEQNEFVYAVNPFSGIDQHWFTGETKEGLTVESETAVRPVDVGSNTQKPTIRTLSVKGQRTWEINAGWRSKTEMLALRDLLETRQAWIVDKTTNKLVPVTVDAGDNNLYDSTEDLQNISIKFKEAHNG